MIENHEIRKIKKEDLDFSYRRTEIQSRKWIIISAVFKFKDGFDLQKVIEIQALRESKQPLDLPNLGSTFKTQLEIFQQTYIRSWFERNCHRWGSNIGKTS